MSDLAPHQFRVVDEASQLQIKVNALTDFIARPNSMYEGLDTEEKQRLNCQLNSMILYLYFLNARIGAFK